jgi:hypothetical protein
MSSNTNPTFSPWQHRAYFLDQAGHISIAIDMECTDETRLDRSDVHCANSSPRNDGLTARLSRGSVNLRFKEWYEALWVPD